MTELLDLRGLRCPLVLVRARQALAALSADEALVVLATDAEAPIDLAALATDHGRGFTAGREPGHWRLVLGPGSGPAPPHARGGAGRPATT